MQQLTVTGSILQEFYRLSLSDLKACCEHFIGTYFFARRSCKYLKVSGTSKTKHLSMKNICFFKQKRLLRHIDLNLHIADTVSITFAQQKHDTKNRIITHNKTSDPLLCPVKIWSKIICLLASYSSSNPNTAVNTLQTEEGKLHYFFSPELLSHLQAVADSIGHPELGLTSNQLGSCSA